MKTQFEHKVCLSIPVLNPTHQGWDKLFAYLTTFQVKLPCALEVLVVNDGSDAWVDPPQDIKKLSFPIKILNQSKNLGKGAAIRLAAQSAAMNSTVFSFTDFDVPYQVEDLVGVVAAVATGSCEVCIGDRTFSSKYQDSVQRSRKLGHYIFRFFARTIIAGGFFDTQCGLKAMRTDYAKAVAEKAKLNGFLFDLEWLYILLRHKSVVRCWPAELEESHQSSSLRVFTNFKTIHQVLSLFCNIITKKYDSKKLWDLNQKLREKTFIMFKKG